MARIVVSILQVTKLMLTEWRSGSKYFDLSALLCLFMPTDFGNKFAVFQISIYYTVVVLCTNATNAVQAGPTYSI